jgi:hypothetical protein
MRGGREAVKISTKKRKKKRRGKRKNLEEKRS